MRQSVIQRAYDAENVLLTCDADEKDYAFSKSRLAVLNASVSPIAANFAAMDETGVLGSMDSQQLQSFLVSQLAYTEARVLSKEYAPREYRNLLPVVTEGGDWAKSIRRELRDRAGRGKRITDQASDLPLVNVEYGEESIPVYDGGIAYEYGITELAQSARLGRPLSTELPDAAYEGYEDHLNAVAMSGEAPLLGMFDQTNVPTDTVTGGGWQNLTPDQILAQLNAQISAFVSNSKTRHWPDTWVMSFTRLSYLASTRIPDGGDKTILSFLIENNIARRNRGIEMRFTSAPELDATPNKTFLYVRREDVIRFHLPKPLAFLPPQPFALKIKVPGHYRYAGVEVIRGSATRYITFPALDAAVPEE